MKASGPINEFSAARRHFLLGFGGSLALTRTSLLSALSGLSAANVAAAGSSSLTGPKALVCVFLHGGNDAYNMLVPRDPDAYSDYQLARGNLALDSGSLHPIEDPTDGRLYGIHPGMQELQTLYQERQLAFVANLGPLIERITIDTYGNGARLPVGLFSHSDQQRHWQTSVPESRTEITGWGGRIADQIEAGTNTNPYVPMSLALEHLNILQNGVNGGPFVLDAVNGAIALKGYNPNATRPKNRVLTQTTDRILALLHDHLLLSTYVQYYQRTLDGAVTYNDAAGQVNIKTQFPLTSIGNQLKQVARAIGARDILGQARQYFVTEQNGYDHHADLLNRQARLLPELSQALGAFQQAMEELNAAQDVVLFTISDFGRSLSSNGDGSDHGWGGHSIVLGGPVMGGQLYGRYPLSLAPGNELDVGRGRLIPTTATDELNAELAMWFGIPNDETLDYVLPNIRNFVDPRTGPPLGFLGDWPKRSYRIAQDVRLPARRGKGRIVAL